MTNKNLNRLNNMLGRELGRNVRGESRYQWAWAPDLRWQMFTDRYDYKADPESGLIIPQPVYEERLLCPDLGQQWVMVLWQEPTSESEWRMMFGNRLEWPRSGTYIPCTARSGYVCLDSGIDPDERITQVFIDQVRIELNKRYVDRIQESERAQEKKERETDRILQDRIDDLVGPFMSVPGKRGYHVSFPDPKQQNSAA